MVSFFAIIHLTIRIEDVCLDGNFLDKQKTVLVRFVSVMDEHGRIF